MVLAEARWAPPVGGLRIIALRSAISGKGRRSGGSENACYENCLKRNAEKCAPKKKFKAALAKKVATKKKPAKKG
jgi:hypothetical protein